MRSHFKITTSLFLLLLGYAFNLTAATTAVPGTAVPGTAAPGTAVPGGIYQWPVPGGAEDLRFADKPVLIIQNTALIGIPIKTQPGSMALIYRQDGSAKSHEFLVSDKAYSEQHITIENQALVSPPPETQQRITDEALRQRALYNRYQPSTDLQDGFRQPVQGIVTSLFGHRRFFNGQPRNPHSGLDIAADTGTPIVAAANGIITLADDLYFNGNTIFIDHGQSLVTMYCHMSEVSVTEGQTVKQGEEIGLVGATGRVTGPHLHWSVSLNGTRVDPQTFTDILNTLVGRSGP